MAIIYDKSKRAHGGDCFASAMVRFNADPDKYVKFILSIMNRFLFNETDYLTFEMKEEVVYIYYCNDELIKTDINSIENYRWISTYTLERMIVNLLEKKNYKFDMDNDYYIGLKNNKNKMTVYIYELGNRSRS